MDTLIFVGLHTLAILMGVVVFFGFGAVLCWRDLESGHLPDWFRFSLISAVGLGLFICLIQILTIFGQLSVTAICVLALFGSGFAVTALRKWSFSDKKSYVFTHAEIVAYILLVAVLLRTVLMPFRPATAWDEVMYHLPHAFQWAENGYLSVNSWLRFPWFPYNYDLLYATALLIWDDALAHLLHAWAGWLCGLMIYQAVRQFADRIHAVVSAIIWLYLSNSYYDTAMIELGLSLFVFSACVAFWLWKSSPKENSRCLYISAFLLGVAAGSKYLPLVYLPLFVIGLLLLERRASRVFLSALCFLLPCIYWYVRNIIVTGDPFNPFGGPLFGFFDWDVRDYASQFSYARTHSEWPPWLLWPALIPLFMSSAWKDTNWRLVIIFSTWSVVTWYVSTGGYVRFLVPAYPVLAIMSARGWVYLATAFRQKIGQSAIDSKSRAGLSTSKKRWIIVALLLLTMTLTTDKLVRDWNQIKASKVQRTAYLQEKISGYDISSHLFDIPHTGIYQFGLENAIFYMPQPTWGDHFGPARYRDMAPLSAELLANKLRSMRIDTLVINREHFPAIHTKVNFDSHFEEILSSNSVTAYRLKGL